VDSAGNAHVTGFTSATDFPIVNGIKTGSFFLRSTDGAANWNNSEQRHARFGSPDCGRPSAPNTLYATTTGGPYRSTDAGATWIKTPTTGITAFSQATALAVDPTNSRLCMWESSRMDFGERRTAATTGARSTCLCRAPGKSVVFDPTTPTTMYVGAGNGVFKSTDGGATFTPQNNFIGAGSVPNVRSLAIDPTAPSTIYAGTSNKPSLLQEHERRRQLDRDEQRHYRLHSSNSDRSRSF
jgi:photosystem II stability/assembly factor-like uncharacterized protein